MKKLERNISTYKSKLINHNANVNGSWATFIMDVQEAEISNMMTSLPSCPKLGKSNLLET